MGVWAPSWQRKVAALLAGFLALFVAIAAGEALAQSSPTYVVGGVRVDVTAQNATLAREQAFAQAPKQAWDRLVTRLALDPAAGQALAAPDGPTLDRMVQAITVEDERRSGTRYIGRFAVSFRGEAVRSFLAAGNVAVVDQRGQALLVAPVMPASATPATQGLWRAAWETGGFALEPRPISVAPATVTGGPDWTNAASAAANAASATAVFAVATQSGQTLTAELVEVGPNGFRRDRGRVTAGVRGGDMDDALRRLAIAANGLLQAEHKALLSTGSAPRSQRVTVSALYGGVSEWGRIKRGLDAADDGMVREVRIEAINRVGALVSFTTLGSMDQLSQELQRVGLALEDTASGAILRAPGPR